MAISIPSADSHILVMRQLSAAFRGATIFMHKVEHFSELCNRMGKGSARGSPLVKEKFLLIIFDNGDRGCSTINYNL